MKDLIVTYVGSTTTTNMAPTATQNSTSTIPHNTIPPKPHALYDGVVAITWVFAFYIGSKCILNICRSIKTLIEIK